MHYRDQEAIEVIGGTTGLVLWLKADGTLWQDSARTTSALFDGDPVGAWDDASGLANNAVQATAANRPLLKLGIQNGLPVLRFDAVNDLLTLGTPIALTGDWSFFSAAIPRAFAQMTYLGHATTSAFIRQNASTSMDFRDDPATLLASTQAAYTVGQAITQGARRSSGSITSLLNGVVGSAAAVAGTMTLNTIAARAGTNLWNGDLAEIVLYNRALTVAEWQAVERAMGARWGVAVA